MHTPKKELALYKKTHRIIASCLPHFGINKKQHILRLVYEIAKRENIPPETLFDDVNLGNFTEIKTYLVKKRFPYASSHGELSKPYLPPLRLDARWCMKTQSNTFYPKNIFVERAVARSRLARRFAASFPEARVAEIPSLSDYIRKNRVRSKIENDNRRRDLIFITREYHDYFKACPCTKGAVGCGYHIFNLSFGCIYDCTYCYLQDYANSPGIIFPANIDKFFDEFNTYKKAGMRIGTGEFSDSLMVDDITEYSRALIEFFKKHKDITFEFKTKSNNITNILSARGTNNIVISWSLNPQKIINENEFFTTTLLERINAARHCCEAGYRVGFHFDPVIHFAGWERHYERVLSLLFGAIKPEKIAWISVGTFRFKPQLKKVIEMRFPGNKILDGELIPGFDGKLRYPYTLRYAIYQKLFAMMAKHSKTLPVYLCMEEKRMWRDLKLRSPF